MKLLLLLTITLALTFNVSAKDSKRPTAAQYSQQMVKKSKQNHNGSKFDRRTTINRYFKYKMRRHITRCNQQYYQYEHSGIRLARENPNVLYENWDRRPTNRKIFNLFKRTK